MANEFLRNVTNLFNTTEDKFTKNILCHIGYRHDDGSEVPHFCGVGECIHAVGFSCKQLQGNGSISDFAEYESNIHIDMQTKLIERFKIDFTQKYKDPIECHFCIKDDIQPTKMNKFEDVINHLNDAHVNFFDDKYAFKHLAEMLQEMSKYYDLQTGEYIYAK